MQIIHQIWLQGEDKIPDKYKDAVQKLKNIHPTYKYMFWDDVSLRKLIKKETPHLLNVYDNYPFWIQRVDLGRYVALYVYGGFYLDMDTIPNEPLDDIIKESGDRPFFVRHSQTLGPYHYNDLTVNNNFLYSPSEKHPFYSLLLKCACTAAQRMFWEIKVYYIAKSTGPYLIVDTINKYLERGGEVYMIVDEERDKYLKDLADESWLKEGWCDTQDKLLFAFIGLLIILDLIVLFSKR